MDRASDLLLRQAHRALRLTRRGDPLPDGAVRSHLGDGRCVVWSPGPLAAGYRCAVDAELADRTVPARLAQWAHTPDPEAFWPAWTRAEAACKLLDVPVVVWLRRYGLVDAPAPRCSSHTFTWRGNVVSCALSAAAPPT